MKTARSAVIEIEDGGLFFTRCQYRIDVDSEYFCDTDRVVTCLYNLTPDTKYQLSVTDPEGKKGGLSFATEYEFVTLNVKQFGAKGDGISDDTAYIQAAVMACPPKSRVLIPAGTYRVTSLFLKSSINIEIAGDAVLLAENDRSRLPVFPGLIQSYDETGEYNLGTWEGNPLKMFTGVITGVDVHDVVIYGQGSIDGNASDSNWWHDVKTMITAFRPRLLFLTNCRNITVHGLLFHDSPSWAIHPYFSRDLAFYGVTVENPLISPNTDGLDPESCQNVAIIGCRFTLGDDCIAIKSGKIYMGSRYKIPSENIKIRQCLMENGHGAVSVGSEIAAGVKNIVVRDCLFRHTDRGIRIKTRRGRGKDSILDGIECKNIVMTGVKTPLVVNCFYFCDPDGRTEYVQSRECKPVDEGTPVIRNLVFQDISCSDVHIAAAFFYGLPEQKIERIEMKNITIRYAEHAQPGIPAMLCGVDPCCKKGMYANNIKELILDHVDIDGQTGDAFECHNIDNM